jgi:hypothetical protein
MEILSMYEVYEAKTGKVFEEAIEDVGQGAIEYLRKQYPRYSRFVLTGFEIDGKFRKLQLWSNEKK